MTDPFTTSQDTNNLTAIHENDCLLGRGGQTNKHVGNRRYRTIVADHQSEYLTAKKKDKVLIARRIVSIVHQNGGRFLKQNSSGQWEEVPDKRAQEKTSQALREGLDVRNKVLRGKMPRRDSGSSTTTPPQKRVKMTETNQSSPVPSAMVSVDGGYSNGNANEAFLMGSYVGIPTPVPFLQYQRALSKSDVTDVAAL